MSLFLSVELGFETQKFKFVKIAVKLSGSYPISSEDIHWADHTENQQHTSEDRDCDAFGEI